MATCCIHPDSPGPDKALGGMTPLLASARSLSSHRPASLGRRVCVCACLRGESAVVATSLIE